MSGAAKAATEVYPTQAVRLIGPFGAGGGPDLLARALAVKLARLWDHPVIVENHAGGGSTAGPDLVAKSQPDGYTLLVNTSAQVYSGHFRTLPYDPLKDFVPVTALSSQPYVLVTGGSSGITKILELIAAAKAKPDQVRFGSTGVGTGTHLGLEKFNLAAGIKALHVPAGANDAIADVIARTVAGNTTYMMAPIPLALQDIGAGRLCGLGVSGALRSALLPEIPTIAEAGITGFNFPIWYGLWAPARTPAAVVKKLANDVANVLAVPDMREWLAGHGATPLNMTQAAFAGFVQNESESAEQIIRAAGIH